MFVKEFRTQAETEEDRFAQWLDFTSQSVKRVGRPADRAAGFHASVRVLDLGNGVGVASASIPSMQEERTPKAIRQSDPEAYLFDFVVSGRCGYSHAGRESVLRPGNLLMCDSSRPFRYSSSQTTSGIALHVSHGLLPLPPSAIESLLAVPISTHRGLAALFVRWLADIIGRAEEFTPADMSTLTTTIVDLLGAVLAAQTASGHALTPESHQRALQLQIREFIRHHLGDPSLSPKTVAAAHNISLRQLHKVFDEGDSTVAAWIRRCRLERCRHELANPRCSSHLVHVIGGRWGFADPAHFSRAFRAAYGMSPTEYRDSALRRVRRNS
ncbi:helix-turn-helix domain-containing protein [Streptomyces sp. SAJ15]|uniref:AraC-like ligand-binding domain-containing protein n=1 Tax=Streptomyces sp. SAJ15 TaxID=2011095 RepID=UPI001184B841|nr:helix-turn-helix domain-containing protein [Streptomyces sp. SAJ15]TVL90276.1 AraC family transcriptional regulator [Streptomyces sp. SAJ15]